MYHAVCFPDKICLDWSKLSKLPEPLHDPQRSWQSRGGWLAGRSADTFRKLFNTYKNFRNISTEQLVQWHWVSSVSASPPAFGKYPKYLYLFSRLPFIILLKLIKALYIKGLLPSFSETLPWDFLCKMLQGLSWIFHILGESPVADSFWNIKLEFIQLSQILKFGVSLPEILCVLFILILCF